MSAPSKTPRPTIRPARFEDAEAIARLWVRSIREVSGPAYGHHSELMDIWSAGKSPEMVKRIIASFNETTIVAELQGHIAGFAIMSEEGEIRACYVAPESVHHGVGRALIGDFEASARAAGLTELTLNSSLNAVPFYEKLGFQVSGHQELFLEKIPCYPMVKKLDP